MLCRTLDRLCYVFAALGAVAVVQSAGRGAEPPNPVALLRGVEEARLKLPPTQIQMTAEYESPRVRNRHRIEVLFDGDRRQFRSAGARDVVRTIFDATQVLLYRDGSATIRDVKQSTADYLFDPRTLGITTTYLWSESVESCLGYRDSKDVSLIDSEEIDGRQTWHVRVVDSHDQQLDFWIARTKGYPVYRHEFRTDAQHYVTTAEYDSATKILPVRVKTIYRNAEGKVTDERSIIIHQINPNFAVHPDTWTLAGLDLAIGTPVSDIRARQRIGYWNGNGLSENPP